MPNEAKMYRLLHHYGVRITRDADGDCYVRIFFSPKARIDELNGAPAEEEEDVCGFIAPSASAAATMALHWIAADAYSERLMRYLHRKEAEERAYWEAL